MLIIRKANETDVRAIAALEQKIFSDPWSERSVHETLLEQHSILLVADKEGQVAGYCIAYSVLDEAEIARIAVDPACRRQGVGQEILEQLQVMCCEKEISHLMLEVREGNNAARAFYRANRFEVDGIRKNYYQSPVENAVLMSKVIPIVPTRN